MKISIWTLILLALFFFAAIMAILTKETEPVNSGNEVGLYLVEYKFDSGVRCYVAQQRSVSCIQVNALSAAKGE